MKRTRTLAIVALAFWLAALVPALANPGLSGAAATTPVPAERDPIRIGIGIGGELIELVNPADHDDDEGDEDGGSDGDEESDEDGNGDGLLDGVVELLVGEGDSDDDDDGNGNGLVDVVETVVEALFGEDDDSVEGAAAAPAVAPRPADDDDDEGLIRELLDVLEFDDLDLLEDLGDELVSGLCQVRHGLTAAVNAVLFFLPGFPAPTCVP